MIKTSNGDFSFSEFYTNTTAMIQEAGFDQAQEFFTLFGATGSNQLTGSTNNFDISTFDDVIEIRNINYTGDIIGAELKISFLNTAAKAGDNESFFDYSAGFEEFAILSSSDAQIIESANIALGDAPQTITYSYESLDAPSGTPEPAWFLLLMIPAILYWRQYKNGRIHA